nr:hypothetical protein Iba_chr15aCG12130 [Ipomoea batatas]
MQQSTDGTTERPETESRAVEARENVMKQREN